MYEVRQHKDKVSRRIDGSAAKKVVKKAGFGTITITQMMAAINSTFPDYEYTVDRNDRQKGTETNEITRNYVNGDNFNGKKYQGGTIDLKYETSNAYINNFTAKAVTVTNIPNPQILMPNRRSIWDAGHALPKQIGGLGDNVNHVFPQSPPVNQGNNNRNYPIIQNSSNFLLWRKYENLFFGDVLTLGHGRWKVHVN